MNLQELASFCKNKGFVFPNSEIYGGLTGFFDFGPLGVELKNNIKNHWWKTFVNKKSNIFGVDGSIISHNTVWKASGHLDNFQDVIVEDLKTKERFRADIIIGELLNTNVEGKTLREIDNIIKKNNVKSPKGNELSSAKYFNLMFKTNIGPFENEKSVAYLRPETAQLIFTNFKNIAESQRAKLPFGIAQIGKAFRNEISPRDFLFRQREFEQLEIEFFLRKDQLNNCFLFSEVSKLKINYLSEKSQNKNKSHDKIVLSELVKNKVLSKWHAYWLGIMYKWFLDLNVDSKKLRVREHLKEELSHYSSATFDIEYEFLNGWREIHGSANRGNFDLEQHRKFSGKNIEFYDEETKQKLLPEVIEPSQGLDRAFLVFLSDAYNEDKQRGNIVLKLHPLLSPYKVAVFPLLSNKKELVKKSEEVFSIISNVFSAFYDKSGSIGRRYARQDEIGTPYCITIDFDSLKNNDVTVRDRDSTVQERVKIKDLISYINNKINLA